MAIKWTEEHIINEIKSITKEDGFIDMTKAGPTLKQMAYRRFGSWINACNLAGSKSTSQLPIYLNCCIKECTNKVRSKHCPWCEMHYYRNRRNGNPEKLFTCQYKVDETIFDEWNDSSAWLLGLLWTDGWMTRGNGIGLKLKDIQLLETAKQELKTDVNFKTVYVKEREYKYFSIANKQLADRLRQIGMHRNKTFTIEYPKGLPDDLFGSFFRGVIDGDGNVWLKKRRIRQQVKDCRVSFVTASELFSKQMQEELKKRNIRFTVSVVEKYLKSGKLCDRWKGRNIWKINIVHQASLRALYKIMYPKYEVPCLHRKRDSFHEWYITPRAIAGNPNKKLGFWTKQKLHQLSLCILTQMGVLRIWFQFLDVLGRKFYGQQIKN